MQHIALFFFLGIIFSCNSIEPNEKSGNEVKTIADLDIYVPSEMSVHMRKMIEINEEIKGKILAGDILTEFPEELLKIYTAKLSDTKNRNETFEAYSKVFIENEKEIFNTSSKIPIITRYNNAISACIMCHKIECVGPIPVIEKLLIP